MYSMLHKLTANKCNTGYCFLGEGTFVYLGGAQVQTARPCVKCRAKMGAFVVRIQLEKRAVEFWFSGSRKMQNFGN